jgi:predicted phage terminase large subunit-like protein
LISDADLRQLERQLPHIDPAHKRRVLELLEERDRLNALKEGREKFIPFVKQVWPNFIPGAHHEIMGEAFERVAAGTLKRLIVNMAPRHSKSELASVMLPAWFLGRFPNKKIIEVSNTESLASGFGRRVRNMISGEGDASDESSKRYRELFPDVWLAKDSQAAAGWHTNKGGEYFAIGVNGRVTGKGADIAIVDDPHDEQQARQAEYSPEIFDGVYDWYTSGIRQRLQPGGAIIIVMTRWSKRDLTGKVIDRMQSRGKGGSGDQWEVIELPAILDEGTPSERPMWPGFWSLKELQDTREEIGPVKFKAQYQQQPTSEQSAILKRDYWRIWASPDEECPSPEHAMAWREGSPPACDYTIGSWDAAATKNDRSHPSAYTLWGVFQIPAPQEYYADEDDPEQPRVLRIHRGKTISNIILLSAFKARMEFPELKKKAKEFYEEDAPDTLLIENKSAGMQLLQEFRAMGIPAESFTGSSRGGDKRLGLSNDKIARANGIADIFASRYVWMPDRPFAREVREQCAEFPSGIEDDLVDSTVQAMIRFRQGGFIRTANDEPEEETVSHRRKRYY